MRVDLPDSLQAVRQRCRLLVLLSALERAGIAPVSMARLHAFAYLADVLSPVWGFVPYDGAILKVKDGPHYADLQQELDRLVILGLVTVLDLNYKSTGENGARIDGRYQLRFESKHLRNILSQLGALPNSDPLDPRDTERSRYLIELAGALATLPDDEIDTAAKFDATYADESLSYSNIVELRSDFSKGSENRSVLVTERFKDFLPEQSSLSPGEKVYLYASYLNKKIHA